MLLAYFYYSHHGIKITANIVVIIILNLSSQLFAILWKKGQRNQCLFYFIINKFTLYLIVINT